MERKMGDSLLRWLGLDKPPQHRVRHKVWKKQQTDRTRQLLLGADRARQRTELEMLDGTDIVREVEAAGARHEAAGAGPEAEFGPAAEEGESGRMLDGWTGTRRIGLRAQVWIRRELGQRLGLVLRQRQSLLLMSPGGR